MFKLRGLDPSKIYRISVNEKPVREMTGEALSFTGLQVHLDSEWRAAVIELTERD